jgi:hypothetical protein
MRPVLLLLFLALPALSIGQSGDRVVKPEIRVGDSWTYRGSGVLSGGTDEYVTRVELSDGKTILAVSTRKADGKEFDSTWSTDWNPSVAVSGMVFKPVPEVFLFPLQIGSSRKVSYQMQRPRAAIPPAFYDLTVRVSDWDDIVVPAGKFRAMKVVAEGSFTRADLRGPVTTRSTFWYVPEVRRWVKYQLEMPNFSGGEELLSYKLNEN